MMKYTIPALALAALAAPAMAEPDCSKAGAAMPMWQVIKSFEEAGGTVRTAKVTGEKCYEIYGRQNDHKVEIYFDPATGAELDRETD